MKDGNQTHQRNGSAESLTGYDISMGYEPRRED